MLDLADDFSLFIVLKKMVHFPLPFGDITDFSIQGSKIMIYEFFPIKTQLSYLLDFWSLSSFSLFRY